MVLKIKSLLVRSSSLLNIIPCCCSVLFLGRIRQAEEVDGPAMSGSAAICPLHIKTVPVCGNFPFQCPLRAKRSLEDYDAIHA